MQAMTLSIGQVGIDFFAKTMIANHLVSQLAGIHPPDNAPKVANFSRSTFGAVYMYSNIKINLSNGSVRNFSPVYKSVKQLASGSPAGSQFQLLLDVKNFSAVYDWVESYDYTYCFQTEGWPVCSSGHSPDKKYSYAPQIGNLDVDVITGFEYDKDKNNWNFTTVKVDSRSS
ncbi:MAG: hypothetical protein QM608_16755, partial [Caulobacter sp.]